MNETELLDAIVRENLSVFIGKTFHTILPGEEYNPNWHIDTIAHHLEQCMKGKIKRLIITMPPRCLKSISTSVAFPAYLLGKDPTNRIICVSYAQDLATKHGNDMRAVLESDWYKKAFPGTRPNRVGNTQTEYRTTKMGGRISTSVLGGLTGRGGNYIIIDDAHKADEVLSESKRNHTIGWLQNTLMTRLDNKENGVIVVIQQRLHESDLVGHLLESGGWVHLNLAAIATEVEEIPIGECRFFRREIGDLLDAKLLSQKVLDQLKCDMGSYAFAAQYQQSPAPQGGGIIKWKWFNEYKNPPDSRPGDRVVQSWDIAATVNDASDYSVCTTWLCSDKKYYLLDVFRQRLEYPALRKEVVRYAEQWNANILLIEASSSGIPLIQDLQYSTALNVISVKPENDKQTRLYAETPAIEGGRVFLPADSLWMAEFQHEMTLFPRGKHDDQVDSMSQFLCYARELLYKKDRRVHVHYVRSY